MAKIEVRVGCEAIGFEQVSRREAGQDASCGAHVLFMGEVRSLNHGKRVVAVAYDAFVPLAEKCLREISEEAIARWGEGLEILILHRTGRLEVGEASVLISVRSPHRAEGYEASRYLIEELKKRAPIWKKEFYENGETEWLKGHALCAH
jgi:molybdopterin synthase catalytic subunit